MEYLRVGLIVRPHGVHGAVKLLPLSDDLGRYASLKEAYLERNGQYEPVTVSGVGVREDAVYASISCCASREDAEKLRNVYLCVDRAHAAKLPPGRYFVVDLIGYAIRKGRNMVRSRMCSRPAQTMFMSSKASGRC